MSRYCDLQRKIEGRRMRSLVQYEGLCAPNCIQYCVVIIQQNNGLYSGGVPVHGRALLVVSHKSVA